MIDLKEFLLNSNINIGVYALVSYDNKIEPIWFKKYNFGKEDWFLEYPCELYEIAKIDIPIDEFIEEYIKELLEDGENEEDYINKYVKPMIIDGVLYNIENFQCSPYLPKEVDDIKLITERECLEYILNNKTINN